MLKTVMVFCILLSCSIVKAEEPAKTAVDPYQVLADVTKLDEHPDDPKGCHYEATLDYEVFLTKMDVFREEWLSRDYSLDFYKQRARQFAAYVISKRVGELVTEHVYYRHDHVPPCSFTFSAKYDDKYGQPKTIELTHWRFNEEASKKVNWEKFDGRYFNEIALDYKYGDKVQEWTKDEPQVGGQQDNKPAEAKEDSCDILMLNANALFVRATTFCKKNYMDSKAGYKALDGFKKCAATFSSEAEMKSKVMKAMKILDGIVRQRGRAVGCAFVEDISREVMKR